MITRLLPFCLLSFFMMHAGAQTRILQDIPPGIMHDLRQHGEVYFMTIVKNKEDIIQISSLVSIHKVSGDTVRAWASEKEWNTFTATGRNYRWIPHPVPAEVVMRSEAGDMNTLAWDFYPTYPAYLAMMAQFQADFPSICRIDTIGYTTNGRLLLAACISGQVQTEEDEPEFLYTSSMHGNELTAYVLMLRLIHHLLTGYGTDSLLTLLVNNVAIYINPLANPDGTYHGGNNTVSGAIRYNANYVDLNRNYPDPQNGPHPDGNPWQAETLAFMDFAEDHDFTMSVNFHGGAEVFNYPWDTWPQLAADNNWWIHVARAYADTVHLYGPSGYFDDLNNGITNGYAWYEVNGGRQDYMNYFHQCREAIIEISNSFVPPASTLPNYWNYNRRSLLNHIRESLFGIRGIVSDSLTSQPLLAKVSIPGHDIDSAHVYSSLPAGNYHRYLNPGSWTLTFSAAGYHTKTISGVTVSNDSVSILNIALRPIGTTLQGTVCYDNIQQSPLAGVSVYLSDTAGNVIMTDTTDGNGYFCFNGLQNATLVLGGHTGQAPGGVNASDALIILKHFVHLENLSGLKRAAADVDSSGSVNSIDALMVQKRFVGMMNSFPAGEWMFTSDTLQISGIDLSVNLGGICTGDVNASYIPLPPVNPVLLKLKSGPAGQRPVKARVLTESPELPEPNEPR
ncbi:MAG TPA: M14 family zinc carboxypeptidase [Bacteroidales bacterium]|nr:M14 family zinc carboxypeptidase [Bacteroidales bacterium]HSA42693.1 M14 family zinc carboxypeptidase [Bacteroidales bacterium]